MGKVVVNFNSKGRIEGYRGVLNSSVRDSNWFNSLYMMTKIRNLCLSASYANIWMYGHSSTAKTEETRDNSTTMHRYVRDSKNNGYRTDRHSVEVQASYDIDDLTLIAAYARIILNSNPHDKQSEHAATYSPTGTVTALYDKLNTVNYDDSEYEASISYERLFGEDARNGKFFVGYKFYRRPISSITNETSLLGASETVDSYILNNLYDYKENSHTCENWHTFEVDWRQVFSKRHTLELIAKLRFRDDETDKRRDYSLKYSTPATTAADSSKFDYKQTFFESSLSYFYTLKKVRITTGVGVQYYDNDIAYPYKDNYYSDATWNFVPWASVCYVPDNKKTFTLNYQLMRSVPNINALNPYVEHNTPAEIYYGNPALKPESTHAVEASSAIYGDRGNINLSASGYFSDNLILEHRFLQDEILHITKDNIGTRRQFRLNAGGRWRATKSTTLRANAALSYKHYNAGLLGKKNHGWEYSIGGTLEQSLPLGLYMEAYGSYNSPYVFLDGEGGKNYNYGFSIFRSFLNRRLSVYLQANNFVPLRYSDSYEYGTQGFRQRFNERYFKASFQLTVKYTFGKLKARPKSTEREINNNDIKKEYSE